MADRARSDSNYEKTLIAVSNADGETPVSLWADPTTHALVISGGSSGGGTQYTNGAAVATPTGSVALGFDGNNVRAMKTDTQGDGYTIITDGTNPLSVATQGSTTTSQSGLLGMAAVTTGSPAYTTGQTAPLSMSTSGGLRTTIGTGTANIGNVGSISATGSAVPANAFYQAFSNASSILTGWSTLNGDGVTSVPGVSLAAYNGSNMDRIRTATAAAGTTGTGLLGVGNLLSDGTNWLSFRTGLADNNTSATLNTDIFYYNGSGKDRVRNNTSVVVVAAGATTGSTTTITTYNARELVLVVNVSAYTSGTINLAVNGVTVSSYAYPLLSAITGLTASGVSTYRVGIGLTPAAGLVANDVLPRSVQVVVSGTFSATFGIDAVLGL
jgi:hypothetical protein